MLLEILPLPRALGRLLAASLLLFLAGNAFAKDQVFRIKKPEAQSVGLAGEFNGWKAQAMSKGGDGAWSVTMQLSPGSYGYKFLVNGSDWIFDPENPNRKTVDGVENSAVEVSSGSNATATPASAAVARTPPPVNADHQTFDFNILAERKRFEFERSGNAHTVTTKEKWGYKVTIENKTFKPMSGLELQYREFKFDDVLRGATTIIGISGSVGLPPLETGQKFTFETTPVEVERLDLRPGWSYDDGAKAKVKDAMAGVWIRILSGSQIVFEWQTPTDLKTKAKWE